MRRVLICGGRNFNQRELVFGILDTLDRKEWITLIIHGGARGADTLAREWAQSRDCGVREFAADWEMYGRGAGPMRNQRMLDKGQPDLVVAFPGGRGTADMVKRARAAGVEVIEIPATVDASQ